MSFSRISFFVREGRAQVVEGAAAGQLALVCLLPRGEVGADGGGGNLQAQGHLGGGQHAGLIVGLLEEPGDGLAFEVAPFGAVGAGFDFLRRQEVQDDGGSRLWGMVLP